MAKTMLDVILSTANQAYNNGECQINRNIPELERGDGLATFIRNELIDVCENEEDITDQVDHAYCAIVRAIDQMVSVKNALYVLRNVVDIPE